ncbi:MAG: 50S ribosomal protein L6 [bacterium]|nr:50S ribosomal protein L6 [bacterium]
MSRIGNKIISIPSGVTVSVEGYEVIVKGTKGELRAPLFKGLVVEITPESVHVTRKSDEKQLKALHGLLRSLLNNHILGVSTGFKKTLKLVGTGYRATQKGQGLSLAVGYSHPVEIEAATGIKLSLEGTDTVHVEGIDKHQVGQMAANIRAVRPPEPYKGKGIRYEDEVVRRKQGKAAA